MTQTGRRYFILPVVVFSLAGGACSSDDVDREMVQQVAEERQVEVATAEQRLRFELEFTPFVEEVAEAFPDQFVNSAVDEDFRIPRGCVYVNDPEEVEDAILEMAQGLSGAVCVEKAAFSREGTDDLLKRVDRLLDWLPPEVEIVTAYRVSDNRLRVDLYNLKETNLGPADLTRVEEQLGDLGATVEFRAFENPFPLE